MLKIDTKEDYFGQLLKWARDRRALYLHAQIDRPFRIRVGGKLEPVPAEIFPVLNRDEMLAGLEEFLGADTVDRIRTGAASDFHFEYGGNRYRAHFGEQQSEIYFSFRAIPPVMFRLKDLQLPTSMRDLIRNPSGLVLFAGPRGHGKGNAARAALREFVEQREARVISIEEPMKYVIPEGRSQVLQREVGIDTPTTSKGLRMALMENPDVIFVNELEDRESIDLALRAADRGILVIGIVAAHSTSEAIERLRCHFTDNSQGFDQRLARCLNAIYFQRMVPNKIEGRTPCVEICRGAPEIARHLRAGDLKQLPVLIERGVDRGMHTFDQYLVELYVAGVITKKVALGHGLNRSYMERALTRPTDPAKVAQ